MIEGVAEPEGPTAVRVGWMRDTNLERVLDDPPDLLGWAS